MPIDYPTLIEYAPLAIALALFALSRTSSTTRGPLRLVALRCRNRIE